MSDPTGKALDAGVRTVAIDLLDAIWEVIPSRGEDFDKSAARRIFDFVDTAITVFRDALTSRKLTPEQVREQIAELKADVQRELAVTTTRIEEIKSMRDPTIDAAIDAAAARLPKKDEE